jgi:hypothetical protein
VLWWESAIADCHLIWDGAHVVVSGESRRVVNVTSIVNIIILPLGQKKKPENSYDSLLAKVMNENLQPAYRNALELAHTRARSKSRLASLFSGLFQAYVFSKTPHVFSFVFRLQCRRSDCREIKGMGGGALPT